MDTEDFYRYNKKISFSASSPKEDDKIFFLPNNDTLIFSVNNHVSVHAVCKSINMWWVFILCLGGEIENNFSTQHSTMQEEQ